ANNSATATTTVISRADLEVISKTDAPDPVILNTPLTYTISLRNNGPSVAANVVLTDVLPPGVDFINCSATGGGDCGGGGQSRTVSFTSLAVGATSTVTLSTKPTCGLPIESTLNNTATITATTIDPNAANNSASAATKAIDPPPTITAPSDRDVITGVPGDIAAIATYPDPVVKDNCPGATFTCDHLSGSSFPLGTTTVTCTATDSHGQKASSSFKVTVWDASIQDEVSKDFILFNTITGDYKFVHCGTGGFTLVGNGRIQRTGCVTQLFVFSPSI